MPSRPSRSCVGRVPHGRRAREGSARTPSRSGDCSETPNKKPFPPAHESLKQYYRKNQQNSMLLHYASVFQIDHEPENRITTEKDLFLQRYHPLDILQATSIYLNIMNPRRPYSLRHVKTGLLSLSDEEVSTFLIQVLELELSMLNNILL